MVSLAVDEPIGALAVAQSARGWIARIDGAYSLASIVVEPAVAAQTRATRADLERRERESVLYRHWSKVNMVRRILSLYFLLWGLALAWLGWPLFCQWLEGPVDLEEWFAAIDTTLPPDLRTGERGAEGIWAPEMPGSLYEATGDLDMMLRNASRKAARIGAFVYLPKVKAPSPSLPPAYLICMGCEWARPQLYGVVRARTRRAGK